MTAILEKHSTLLHLLICLQFNFQWFVSSLFKIYTGHNCKKNLPSKICKACFYFIFFPFSPHHLLLWIHPQWGHWGSFYNNVFHCSKSSDRIKDINVNIRVYFILSRYLMCQLILNFDKVQLWNKSKVALDFGFSNNKQAFNQNRNSFIYLSFT